MPKADREAQLVAAAFRLLARKDWRTLTLAAVVRAAKLKLAEALAVAPSKTALAGLILRTTAQETARRYRPDRASRSARERLFDVAMTWFEVQQPRKPAMRALYAGLRGDPLVLFSARGAVIRSAEQMLALAEADNGPLAPVLTVAFAGILSRGIFVWIDDNRDMDKTMAALDRDLGRMERVLLRRDERAQSDN